MFGRFDARLRRLEALSPDRTWLHESGLESLLVYAWLRPLPWDMPDLDAEDEVIGLAVSLSELSGFRGHFGDVWRGLVSPVLQLPRRHAQLCRERLPRGHASTSPACPARAAPRPLLRYVPWILTMEDMPTTSVWDAQLGGYGPCRFFDTQANFCWRRGDVSTLFRTQHLMSF
jgi:hypothetical protein